MLLAFIMNKLQAQALENKARVDRESGEEKRQANFQTKGNRG